MSAHVFKSRQRAKKKHEINQHKMCIRMSEGQDKFEAMFEQVNQDGNPFDNIPKQRVSLLNA